MARRDAVVTSTRLTTGWWAAGALALVTAVGALGLLLAVTSSGAVAAAYSLLVAAWAMAVVVLVVALVLPRSAGLPPSDGDGTVVVRAPGLLVWCSVGAFLTLLCSACAMGYLMLTDLSRIEAPGAAVVVVLGAVASLPDLVRLVTGRLHPWRLTLTAEGFTYQGRRHAVREPWSAVRRARVTHAKSSGVTIDLAGGRPDVLVPAAAFLVPPHVLAEAINGRLRR